MKLYNLLFKTSWVWWGGKRYQDESFQSIFHLLCDLLSLKYALGMFTINLHVQTDAKRESVHSLKHLRQSSPSPVLKNYYLPTFRYIPFPTYVQTEDGSLPGPCRVEWQANERIQSFDSVCWSNVHKFQECRWWGLDLGTLGLRHLSLTLNKFQLLLFLTCSTQLLQPLKIFKFTPADLFSEVLLSHNLKTGAHTLHNWTPLKKKESQLTTSSLWEHGGLGWGRGLGIMKQHLKTLHGKEEGH